MRSRISREGRKRSTLLLPLLVGEPDDAAAAAEDEEPGISDAEVNREPRPRPVLLPPRPPPRPPLPNALLAEDRDASVLAPPPMPADVGARRDEALRADCAAVGTGFAWPIKDGSVGMRLALK